MLHSRSKHARVTCPNDWVAHDANYKAGRRVDRKCYGHVSDSPTLHMCWLPTPQGPTSTSRPCVELGSATCPGAPATRGRSARPRRPAGPPAARPRPVRPRGRSTPPAPPPARLAPAPRTNMLDLNLNLNHQHCQLPLVLESPMPAPETHLRNSNTTVGPSITCTGGNPCEQKPWLRNCRHAPQNPIPLRQDWNGVWTRAAHAETLGGAGISL